MTRPFSLRDLGQTPSLSAVIDYLGGHGWRTRRDGQHMCCEGPPDDDGQPIVQFLPASEAYADYPLRLEDLVRVLCVIEERPAVEIVREMVEPLPTMVGAGFSLREVIMDEFRRSASDFLSNKESQRLAEELSPLLLNVESAADGGMDVFQQAALLISGLARRLPGDTVGSPLLFGSLCARLLAHLGLQCAQPPSDFVDLLAKAQEDDPAAPEEVLIWIRERFRRSAGVAPAPESRLPSK